MTQPPTFVLVLDYPHRGRDAFGEWQPESGRYVLDDGDGYTLDQILTVGETVVFSHDALKLAFLSGAWNRLGVQHG